jgi:hypothetical protein
LVQRSLVFCFFARGEEIKTKRNFKNCEIKNLKKFSASNTATYSAQQQHQEQYDAKAQEQ